MHDRRIVALDEMRIVPVAALRVGLCNCNLGLRLLSSSNHAGLLV
jgi:hypothetical protein